MTLDNELIAALARINQFKSGSLRETISKMQQQLAGAGLAKVKLENQTLGVDQGLLLAAAAVKQASAQIDTLIHAAGILYALPHILRPDEVVESLSLGADNAQSEFDLMTDQRIAEFKFIYWQGGSEAMRKKTLFQDFVKLAREQTSKEKYLYLLDVDIPRRFLRGGRNVLKVLDKDRHLADDFVARYGQTYRTVGEYYRDHEQTIQLVDLKIIPGFEAFYRRLSQIPQPASSDEGVF